ncbi:somatostatin receptor type 2 [Octopus bimaculoides]|uniref:G-protein coupled receptors family 1 profile domain-containing protein n=1 Tax=Octopus bimaculoides TaxID=37653 RepID=A0A0L8GF50_OCTBM|nr:somatostatin receptor type 2 [Octopus bimaculoides]XP_014781589.1 somatostatin receptor type 2 [Octopus bimaculoides]XP_052831887.1 somatostatin receptor type 2 [Octopus bimaculoides]|eukprot:XP_014781588.1 PREDICTED: somatostatin receptor type 2-like [Octopus bimaculoides]
MESLFNETVHVTEQSLFSENFNDTYPDMDNSFSNGTEHSIRRVFMEIVNITVMISNSLICITGLFGNCLVIYVVTMFSKMKTVTNTYILNLAIADVLFLVSIPLLIVTIKNGFWMFGFFMCKFYYLLVSINSFTGVFTLTVMSADRYLAVCHPIKSMSLRTPKVAFIITVCIWLISILIMLPALMYSTTVRNAKNRDSCTMVMPDHLGISPDKIFIWYNFIFSYAIPVPLISVFYISVVHKLRTTGPVKKSSEKKKSQKRVTRMVLTVIGVYIICWLPYWAFQLDIVVFTPPVTEGRILMFQTFNILTYANSMLNPLLYNFLSDNFRKSFTKAFKCTSRFEVNRSLRAENSIYPKGREAYSQTTVIEKQELQTINHCATENKVQEDFANGETQTEDIDVDEPEVVVTELE